MTKMATVHAQQKWEYRSTTKHTESALLNDLNELGKAGWELVGASYNKDLKGIWAWTAILKRPYAAQSITPTAQQQAESGQPASQAADPKSPGSPAGFDLSGDTFDLKTS